MGESQALRFFDGGIKRSFQLPILGLKLFDFIHS